VGEQTTRVLTILFLAFLFMKKGYSLYLVGGGAMFGSITGSLISGIILFMFVWIRKEWMVIAPRQGMFQRYAGDAKKIFKALVYQGLTICISGMLMIFIQLADAMNLYSLLVESGIEKDLAKSLKGIFDRGQPLIQLGTIAATSMSLTLVPLITRERLAAKPEFLQHKIQVALKVSVIFGVGASSGLWAIMKPTNTMLFENEAGSAVLGVLGFVILFTSITSTIIAIMQGLGVLLFPAIVAACIFPVKYILNNLFVPLYGTMGAAISSLISLGLVTVLLLIQLKRVTRISLFSLRFSRTVITATATMLLFLKVYLSMFGTDEYGRIEAVFQSLSAVIVGGFLFLLIIIRGSVFREEELALFPFGSKLIKLMDRKDRN
jgi:PST family polysaccharide transporter